MNGIESYLLDVGWIFFAAWSLVVLTVSVIAFARDFVSIPGWLEEQSQGTGASPVPTMSKSRL